jgi:hypothetical protein
MGRAELTTLLVLGLGGATACQSYQLDPILPTALGARTEVHVVSAKRAHLMLVVDRSGSMNDSVPGTSSKMNALKQAFASPGGFLESNASVANFGLILFPDGGSCEAGTVKVPVGADADSQGVAKDVADKINGATPGGGTPTAASLANVLTDERMLEEEAGRDRFVMLLTDGAPNCNSSLQNLCDACNRDSSVCSQQGQCRPTYSQTSAHCDEAGACLDESAVVAQVKALADRKIRTFVIGFGAATHDPSSDAYHVLDEAAVAGGLARVDAQKNPVEPRFYQAGSTQELSEALNTLIGIVNSCAYPLSPPPAAADLVEVVFVYASDNNREVALVRSTATKRGDWDASTSTVTIHDPRCAEIKSAPAGLAVECRYVISL